MNDTMRHEITTTAREIQDSLEELEMNARYLELLGEEDDVDDAIEQWREEYDV